MVDNSSLRDRLKESTKGIWGSLNNIAGADISKIFGRIKGTSTGSSNYYDIEAFYAAPAVNVGEHYKYVYAQMKAELKPRKFLRYNGGVKITEEQATLDNETLAAMVQNAAEVEQRAVNAKLAYDSVGYAAEQYLVSAMNGQGTANSSIIDPADCNATPGTAAALGTVNFIGGGQTERNLEATVGALIRMIGAKVLDATTGETILHNDGSDTYDLWVHPSFAHMLDTSYDLLDTGEHDSIPYTQRLATSWKTTVRPSMAIATCTMVEDATTVIVLTANTAENFKIVDVEAPIWMAWKEIDDGETISVVKRYKAGQGAVARPYLSGTQAYKAMAAATVTPNGA